MTHVPLVDVVGVGLNAADTLIQLPHFPTPDSKVEFTHADLLLGGQVATAMVACQAWGLHTRYVGKVGGDSAAALHRRALKLAGVEAHLRVARAAPSQKSFILVDQRTGERTVLWHRDPRIALLPQDLKKLWITQARALLVDGHDTASAARAALWARQAKIPVVADTDNVYPGIEDLLEHVDQLICSEQFPQRLTGQADLLRALPQLMNYFSFTLVAATLGADGVVAWDGTQFHYSPAFAVRAIDTTGAGDVFHAAFIYALLAGCDIGRQLQFSCAAAALNCTGLGARGGIRPLREIKGLLRDGEPRKSRYSTAALAHAAKQFKIKIPKQSL